MATGAERVKAAFKRTFADYVPAYPILGCFTSKLIGTTARQYLQDAEIMAKSQMAAYEMFQPDIVVMMADLLMEAETLGTTLKFPENDVCQVEKHSLREDKGKLGSLSVPDPEKEGRMPLYLEACSQVRGLIKDVPVSSTLVGPWAIAASLRGVDTLIYDTFDDPGYVHELMRLATDTARAFGEAVITRKVSLSYSEATVSCSVISPQIYRDFVLPYHQELVNHFKEKRAGITWHVCGFADPILSDLVETGASGLSIDSMTSLEKSLEVGEGKTVIIGNVPTTSFLKASWEQIEGEVKKCFEAVNGRSGYILSSGCEVPPNSPVDAVKFFMDAARKLGKC
ncbi:MAG TPA: hypothetical protein GX711_10540 [Clostridia bacterium]|nr:hypothetical protein [Clostridia bacterium]